MYEIAKASIRVYGKLNRTAQTIEGMIGRLALSSFSSTDPCLNICQRMCALIEKKNLAVNLKLNIKRSLNSLSKDDIAVLAMRFGRYKGQLYLSRRTYFRRLNSALKSLTAALALNGVDEHSFESVYAKRLVTVATVYDEVCEEERMKKGRVMSLRLNKRYSAKLTAQPVQMSVAI